MLPAYLQFRLFTYKRIFFLQGLFLIAMQACLCHHILHLLGVIFTTLLNFALLFLIFVPFQAISGCLYGDLRLRLAVFPGGYSPTYTRILQFKHFMF